MVLPDIRDEQRKGRDWISFVKGLWRYVGFVAAGFMLAVLVSDVTMRQLLVVPIDTAPWLDSTLFVGIVIAIVFLVSLWACGRHVITEARKRAHVDVECHEKAFVVSEQKINRLEKDKKEYVESLIAVQREYAAYKKSNPSPAPPPDVPVLQEGPVDSP